MRIDWTNAVVGVGAGVVDEVLEWQDEANARTELWQQWTTWGRVGLCALGYLGQAFNFFPRMAVPLAQSEVTLVTKTVGAAIRAGTGAGRMVTRARTRVRSPISQTPKPGFEGLRTY